MKHVLLLASLLLAVGGWAAMVEPPTAAEAVSVGHVPQIEWIRTVDGWEYATHLKSKPPADASLHPVVVAGFMMLSGMLVLLAPPSSRHR